MVGVDPIIFIALDVVPGGRDQLVEHPGICRRRIGDHLGRSHH
jgi:hypothetical protein